MKRVVQQALQFAKGQVGQREDGYSNWSDPVAQYLASIGITFPASWCAAFVYWCVREAYNQLGLGTPIIPRTGYCPSQLAWGRAEGIVHSEPAAGDIFLSVSGGVAHHTGFVTAANGDGTFASVSGNTNSDGGAQGYGVLTHTYPVAGHLFLRWNDLVQDDPAATYALYLNGTKLWDMSVHDGHAYAPVRVLLEAMGDVVTWDDARQLVTANGADVPVQVALWDAGGTYGVSAFAPVRDLCAARCANVTDSETPGPGELGLRVDNTALRVDVFWFPTGPRAAGQGG